MSFFLSKSILKVFEDDLKLLNLCALRCAFDIYMLLLTGYYNLINAARYYNFATIINYNVS
jgi:hypothetical protein